MAIFKKFITVKLFEHHYSSLTDWESRGMGPLKTEKWIGQIVDRLARRLPDGSYDRRDLISAAHVGVLEAKERFEESHGVPFEKFAYLRVRGAVVDQIRKDCFLSVSGGKYAKLRSRMEDADYNLTQSEIYKVQSRAKDNALAFKIEYQDENHHLKSESLSIEEKIDQFRTLKNFTKIFGSLSKQEQKIIEKYYFKGQTFKEIAEERKMTKSGVWKIHKKVINKIKSSLGIDSTYQVV